MTFSLSGKVGARRRGLNCPAVPRSEFNTSFNQEHIINILPILLGATLLTVILLFVLRPLAFKLGLLDQPDGRKQHHGSIPLVGGIGMALSFSIVCLLFDFTNQFTGLLIGIGIVTVVGLWDDFRELGSLTRFIAQIAAAGAMIYLDGALLEDLGNIGFSETTLTLGFLSVPITIFSTVGVINALNMIDGVDGLAGSISIFTLFSIAFLAGLAGYSGMANLGLLLAAILLGFLFFNWRPMGNKKALVFMGDAGSMFLGFVICWFFIKLSQGDNRAFSPVTALWIFAVPLIDTVTMMIRRMLKGQSPFKADREHFHHILILAGISQSKTVLIMLGISILCAGTGIAGELLNIPENLMFLLFMLLFAGYFWTIKRAWKVMRFTKHLHNI